MNNFLVKTIIILLLFSSCKKNDEHKEIKRVEIYSTRGWFLVDNTVVKSPNLFFWEVGETHNISTLASWSGEMVTISIYKDLVLDVERSSLGEVELVYDVKP